MVVYDTGQTNPYSIMVGTSKVDLGKYLDKQVVIRGDYSRDSDNGQYKFSDVQCIAGKCHNIFESRYGMTLDTIVVNIEEVKELPPR